MHVDPTVGGWDTEAFSEQASKQLKVLANGLRQAGTDAFAATLEPLVHEDFRCVALRPAELNLAFEDARLRVDRWERVRNRSPKPDHRGLHGFRRALESLVTTWKGHAEDVHVKFKIVGVTPTSSYIRTKILAQIAGETKDGYVQQNMVWTCAWRTSDENDKPLLAAISVEEFEQITSLERQGTLLADTTGSIFRDDERVRQQFQHGVDYWRDRLDWRLGLDIVGPHGLAVGDVNGDGYDDVFLCEPGGLPNRLYLQQADGTVADISATAGIDYLEPATSALFVDMDNDGDQDLMFTSGRTLIGCENDGSGTFQRRTLIRLEGGARSIASADYDRDGKLDIYVCCYFHSDSALAGVGLGLPMPYHDANNGPPNVLLRNAGNWTYEDVTEQLGLDESNRRFSFAAAWEDYDNDGDVDLYVANDFGRNNLFRNDGGKFADVAADAGVEDVASGMSVSWGDYNRDGWVDLYIGNMYSSAGNRITFQSRFRSGANDEGAYRRLARGNSLFENNGDGTFRDVSLQAKANMGRWAWGCLFADLNSDGWEDLLVGNGMVTSEDDPGDL